MFKNVLQFKTWVIFFQVVQLFKKKKETKKFFFFCFFVTEKNKNFYSHVHAYMCDVCILFMYTCVCVWWQILDKSISNRKIII